MSRNVIAFVISWGLYSTAVHLIRAYGVPYWVALGACCLVVFGAVVQPEFRGRRCATGEAE